MILEGKTVSFLGDSITEGVGVSDIKSGRYDNIMKKRCNIKETYNYGIGGTRIAHQTKPSEKPRFDLCFCGRAYDINPDSDIIIVYGGVNDYIHGDAPFGNFGDSTPSTFCGGVEFLMKLLKELYPDSKIIFMAPARMCHGDIKDEFPSPRECKSADSKPLKEYAEIIERTGEKNNIPVLNLYEKFEINPNIPEHKEKYTDDGLHFNDEGHKLLANLLIDFIKNL